jgi:NADH oxidoreductase Hcr
VRAFFAVTRDGGTADLWAGRIDESLVRYAAPNVRDHIAMVCGPKPMIAAMRELFGSMGVAADQIRSELFEAAVAASTGHQPGGVGAASVRDAAAVTVRCVQSQTNVRAHAHQTLLDAAEAGGVAIQSLCRAGLCGTCRTRVLEGDVSCESTVLEAGDRQRGFVLACVAHARTDCAIEA